LAGSAGDRRTEVVRAYRLASRAVFTWAAAALAHAGEEGRARGLASLERFAPFDSDAAMVAAVTLRAYPTEGLDGQARLTCLAAAEAAESAAEIRVRGRGGDAVRSAAVGRAAAITLCTAFAAAAITNIVTPASEAVEELISSPESRARRLNPVSSTRELDRKNRPITR